MNPTPNVTLGYHELPLTMLVPSTQNPRKTLGDVTDLAASIREVGILEPILVRPRERGETPDTPETPETCYEVVAGSRRHAAAQAAGLLLVPCLVRALTDAQALEVAIVENNQRGDIHPLDEAEAFASLAGMNRLYTPDVIAAKIGRPKAYVTGRLRLLNLVPAVREAFAADRLTVGHAARIARLKSEIQERALRACYLELFQDDEEEGGPAAFDLLSVAWLDKWVREHVVIDLADPLVQETLPELAETVARVEGAGGTVIRLSDAYYVELDDANGPAPLPRSKWVEILADLCAHAQPGVIVYGSSEQPTMLSVCVKDSACPTHWPAPAKAAKRKKSAWEKEEERRRTERELFEAQKTDLYKSIADHLLARPIDTALVDLLVTKHHKERLTEILGGPPTDETVVHWLWMSAVLNISTWNPDEFSAEVQAAAGFDVAAWRAANAPAAPETTKKAAKRQKASK